MEEMAGEMTNKTAVQYKYQQRQSPRLTMGIDLVLRKKEEKKRISKW